MCLTIMRLLSSLYERFKGSSFLLLKNSTQEHRHQLEVYLQNCMKIVICCEEIHYLKVYSRFYIRNQSQVLYKMQCIIPENADCSLQVLKDLVFIIPDQLSRYAPRDRRLRVVINAYLDLVIAKLQA